MFSIVSIVMLVVIWWIYSRCEVWVLWVRKMNLVWFSCMWLLWCRIVLCICWLLMKVLLVESVFMIIVWFCWLMI